MILAGCSGGSHKLFMGSINYDDSRISGSYKSFSGYNYKLLKLETGTTIRFNFEESTEEGSIIMQFIDNNKEVLLTLEDACENKDVVIKKTGNYQIRMKGSDHKGNFEISWKIDSD